MQSLYFQLSPDTMFGKTYSEAAKDLAFGTVCGFVCGLASCAILPWEKIVGQPTVRKAAAANEQSQGSQNASAIRFTPTEMQDTRGELIGAVKRADEMMRRFKLVGTLHCPFVFSEERGVPGIAVGVSVNGDTVWETGYGYTDLENMTACTGDSVMRIGSISKSLTMTLVAKLMQENKLDLDAPIQKYVPAFPEKQVDGEKVTITTRHLVSHFAGIRHYEKPKNTTTAAGVSQTSADASKQPLQNKPSEEANASAKVICEKCQTPIQKRLSEFQYAEYYSQKQYNSVTEALAMFKDDPLLSKPGTTFKYTTHGWTLVGAVVEGASGKKLPDVLKELFSLFGMRHTHLDENYPLIPNRTQHYRRKKDHRYRLENVPPVNNSYKWAGGGIVSNVGDLLRFANALSYFYHNCPRDGRKMDCYLNRNILNVIWTPIENAPVSWASSDGTYAMGWAITPDRRLSKKEQFYVCHTGGSVGASSALLLKPTNEDAKNGGIAVAILTNLQECGGLFPLAQAIAETFEHP